MNNNRDRLEQLTSLDEELGNHLHSSLARYASLFLPGRGSLRPKVVFLLPNPWESDLENETAYFSDPPHHLSDSYELLFHEVRQLELHDKCYYMYALPFNAPRDDPPTDAELHLFLPFARRRLEILRPSLVVALSLPSAKYVFSSMKPNALSANRVPCFDRALDEQKPERRVRVGAVDVMALHCPHPFGVLKDGLGSWKRKVWNACFARVDAIANQYHVRGPRTWDKETRRYSVAAFPVMRSAQDAKSKEPPVKPRKTASVGLGKNDDRKQPGIAGFCRKRDPLAEEEGGENAPALKKQRLFISPDVHP